jgi:hypothetical protein
LTSNSIAVEEGAALVRALEKNSTLLFLKLDQNPHLLSRDVESIDQVCFFVLFLFVLGVFVFILFLYQILIIIS